MAVHEYATDALRAVHLEISQRGYVLLHNSPSFSSVTLLNCTIKVTSGVVLCVTPHPQCVACMFHQPDEYALRNCRDILRDWQFCCDLCGLCVYTAL